MDKEQEMAQKIDSVSASIAEIEAELGRRLETCRLAANVSQAQLAADSGVSRRTITRLENGGGVSLDTLIRVMRALGLAGRLNALLADSDVRPIDRVRLKGKQRRRARPGAKPAAAEWTWGDARADAGGGDAANGSGAPASNERDNDRGDDPGAVP